MMSGFSEDDEDRYMCDDDGYNPQEGPEQWDDDGYDPQEVPEQWDDDGYDPQEGPEQWEDDGYDPQEGPEQWDDDGYDPQEVPEQWDDDGYDPQEGPEQWDDDGYDPQEGPEQWEYDGYDPQEGPEQWDDDGYDPQEVPKQWDDDGYDPQEGPEQWEYDGYDPQEGPEQWDDDGYDPQEVPDQWDDDGYDPQEGPEQWEYDGYDPQEGPEQWDDDGYDPQEGPEQWDDGYDPQEGPEQWDDGYDPQEGPEQWDDGYNMQDYDEGNDSLTWFGVPEYHGNEEMHSAGNENSEHLEIDKQEDNSTESHKAEENKIRNEAKKDVTTSEAEHLSAVKQIMKKKGTLEHNLSHGVMVGPARSGKSSLMSRLVGEMPSSTSPSTGVAEKVVHVVGVRKSYSIALSVHDTIWFKLLYDEEAIRLMKLAFQNIPSQPQQPAAPLTDSSYRMSSPSSSIQSELENISPTEHTHEPFSTSMSVTTPLPEGYIAPMEVFKGAIQEGDLESLRKRFENSWTFYLTDTGGQVEFQELIPLLVSGPSVFFFTFRLDQDLNQQFTIEYHLSDGARSKPYKSTLTVVEAILQTLASVASIGTFTYESPQVKSISLKPKMFIVGTHKDKLNPATGDSEIKKIDQHLQKVIMSTSHYEEDIVQFASKSQLIFAVNNFSKDDSDFKEIRSGVEHVVCHSQFKVHFPTHWLIFSFVLRQEMIKDSIISYEQCFSIAKDCGIADHEEFNHALWFLHTKIGLIRHFPMPGLHDFVIRDPQILFDMVTKLIVNTFTFENLRKLRSTIFKRKGIFSLRDFEIVNKDLYPMLPPKRFLQLLEHLQIVAPFQEKNQQKFFIPCVLAHSEECESQSLPQSSDIPPLLITFKCGYCPKGLPGALITHLLTNRRESKFKWVLKTDQIFRNQVSFLVSSCDIITVKIHPTFLELIHSSARKGTGNVYCAKQSICNKVRCNVQNGIRSISSKMNLTSNAKHSLSFYCQNFDCNEQSACSPHPAMEIVEDEDGTRRLWCKQLDKIEISVPPQGSSVWFESDKHSQESGSLSMQQPQVVDSCPTYSKFISTCTKPTKRALETLSDDDLDGDQVSAKLHIGCIVINCSVLPGTT